MRAAFLCILLCGCATAPASYDSGVAAAANKEVRGTVIFRIFTSAEPHSRRIARCYLQHGFGAPAALEARSAFRFDSFTDAYYGPDLIAALGEVCGEVIVGVQESITTSILEMTERTERFLRDAVCNAPVRPGQKGCAYIGHSKGGAVAYNVARRCMQQTSSMGPEACGRLAEVFSSAGVVQGALLTFTALGAYAERKKKTQSDFVRLLGGAADTAVHVYEDYVPGKTNPVWMDLSPAAPMENGQRLFDVNSVPLRRTGWFSGDYASLASDFDFESASEIGGCEESLSLFAAGCRRFGRNAAVLHGADLKDVFLKGVAAMSEIEGLAGFMREHRELFTWENQQKSDGLADYLLAHRACVKGLEVPEPMRAVRRCETITEMNHWASSGRGPAARRVMIEELSR